MTDKYTPTTWEVRAAWAEFDGCVSTVAQYAEVARIEFDRWLSEVKAKAWTEGAEFGVRDQHGTVDVYIRDAIERHNPYRLVDEDE